MDLCTPRRPPSLRWTRAFVKTGLNNKSWIKILTHRGDDCTDAASFWKYLKGQMLLMNSLNVATGNTIFSCWGFEKGRNGSSRLAEGGEKREKGRRRRGRLDGRFLFLFVGCFMSILLGLHCAEQLTVWLKVQSSSGASQLEDRGPSITFTTHSPPKHPPLGLETAALPWP